ncbi:MAG: hypothetical protein OFPII_11390 [Osedax symbiont Rs1]|nr:MAG: hypothetical protein OFPII_11390 [Osedax symbiont Rs1]
MGTKIASRPKAEAKAIAPIPVITQANIEIGPKQAKAEGSKNIPEPIMLPTTNAVHISKPSAGLL